MALLLSTSHLLHTTLSLIPLLLCVLVLAQALVVSSSSASAVAAAAPEGSVTTISSSKPTKPPPAIIAKPTTDTTTIPKLGQVASQGNGGSSSSGSSSGGSSVKIINPIAFDSKFKKVGTPPALNADPAIATAEKQALQLLRFKQRSSMLEKFTMLMKDETFKNITDFKFNGNISAQRIFKNEVRDNPNITTEQTIALVNQLTAVNPYSRDFKPSTTKLATTRQATSSSSPKRNSTASSIKTITSMIQGKSDNSMITKMKKKNRDSSSNSVATAAVLPIDMRGSKAFHMSALSGVRNELTVKRKVYNPNVNPPNPYPNPGLKRAGGGGAAAADKKARQPFKAMGGGGKAIMRPKTKGGGGSAVSVE